MNQVLIDRMAAARALARETIHKFHEFSVEQLKLSIDYVHDAVNRLTSVNVENRFLVCVLDAHDTPITNDRIVDSVRERWPDVEISEVIFDRNTSRIFVFAK